MIHTIHIIDSHKPPAPVPASDTRSPQTPVAADCHTEHEKDDHLADTTSSPDSTRSHHVASDGGCVAGIAVVGTVEIGRDECRHERGDSCSNGRSDVPIPGGLAFGHFGHHRLWWMTEMTERTEMTEMTRPLRVMQLVRYTVRRMLVQNRCNRAVCAHQARAGAWSAKCTMQSVGDNGRRTGCWREVWHKKKKKKASIGSVVVVVVVGSRVRSSIYHTLIFNHPRLIPIFVDDYPLTTIRYPQPGNSANWSHPAISSLV